MEFKKEELVKSPLNYTGGKYKLLPQILPLFPNDVNVFYDLFCGGCNVGVNVKANKVICNDSEVSVIDFMNQVSLMDSSVALDVLKKTILKYQLSKTNREGFEEIRNDYNNGERNWNMFYAMVANAFNYQIRFNKKGNYNMPFGKNRSSFNPTLEQNFIKFINKINDIDIDFWNSDFKHVNMDLNILNPNDLVYCDPPYLITLATYNEKDGWNETHERELLNFLDRIHEQGSKFALSNVLENKGKTNEILKEWSKKYKINYLNKTYGNCNYHAKDKTSNTTTEVLITNY